MLQRKNLMYSKIFFCLIIKYLGQSTFTSRYSEVLMYQRKLSKIAEFFISEISRNFLNFCMSPMPIGNFKHNIKLLLRFVQSARKIAVYTHFYSRKIRFVYTYLLVLHPCQTFSCRLYNFLHIFLPRKA